MLKFLLILIVVMYLFFRIGGYLIGLILRSSGNEQDRKFSRKPRDGNVSIDYDPKEKRKDKGYQGGEYVDYEEVD